MAKPNHSIYNQFRKLNQRLRAVTKELNIPNTKGTVVYNWQVEFAYAQHQATAPGAPEYIKPKHLSEAEAVIEKAEAYLKDKKGKK